MLTQQELTSRKIQAIKQLRANNPGMGLKEAKDAIELAMDILDSYGPNERIEQEKESYRKWYHKALELMNPDQLRALLREV